MPTDALVKVTVFEPGVNVPPDFAQLPETLNVPEGAVKTPLLKVTSVVVTAPPAPVKVPPEIVKPPLNVCVAAPAR